jgi:hypothetical protein
VNIIEASRQPSDRSLLYSGVPSMEATVRSPTTVIDADSGLAALVTIPFPADLGEYRRAARAYPIQANGTRRGGGVANASRTFGYLARSGIFRRSCCMACSGALTSPEAHEVISGAAGDLAGMLAELQPERAAADLALVSAHVHSDWLMTPTSPWSSGVLNRTSPLPYHRDRNNFPAWSAMVVLRRGVRGGHLHVPEYNIVVECRDGDVVYFAGSDLMHGVTPMMKTTPDSYRLSAVYYPVASMATCLPFAEEVVRGQRNRSDSEDGLIERQRREGTMT